MSEIKIGHEKGDRRDSWVEVRLEGSDLFVTRETRHGVVGSPVGVGPQIAMKVTAEDLVALMKLVCLSQPEAFKAFVDEVRPALDGPVQIERGQLDVMVWHDGTEAGAAGAEEVIESLVAAADIGRASLELTIPRFETSFGGTVDAPVVMVHAVCEPEGYCRDGHRCGKLNLGVWRDPSVPATNDLRVFSEEWVSLDGVGITGAQLDRCCDGDEVMSTESEDGPAEHIGYVHAAGCPLGDALGAVVEAGLDGHDQAGEV